MEYNRHLKWSTFLNFNFHLRKTNMYETLTAFCIALYYCCCVFIHAVIDKYEEQIKLKIIQTQGKAKNAGMIFLLNTLGFNMFNWLECRIFESKNRFSGHTHRVRSVLQLQLFPFAGRKKRKSPALLFKSTSAKNT